MAPFLFFLLGTLFLLIVLSLITLLILSGGKKRAQNAPQGRSSMDLDGMISRARDENLSDNDLRELAEIFISTHTLGSKTQKELSQEVKKKLEFVRAFASNPKSSAASIGFLNRGLKKLSNSYGKDIDAYEQKGLEERGLKKA
ncbi:hypothetical protein [Campylobacter sp.]|uniref:hypothetical protein n=1 Tax=Campylobacter sp. TaxID=205 RepID=UPI0026DBDB3D|nr:hypothetical protein [Campylobacter sp.]MDO4674554.1 hypothetical protein [Campylobacter sp.]